MDSFSVESAREMEERFAVTAATGALGPVLKKLAALLGDEYKLRERTRRDIMVIKSELEPVHDLLAKLWGRLDLDVACRNWMTEARALSYDMEDDIDSFTLGMQRGRGDDGRFIQRDATDSPFKKLMERVKDVSKQCGKMHKVGDTICNSSKLTTDPRALFLHRDPSELVGMEEQKQDLIRLLQKHEMVCILGPGGMGKTTLADLVYHEVGDEFQCRAFVSVHPSPNMTEILGTILSQVTDGATKSAGNGTQTAAEQNIVTDISISLSEKRYLVIIDDIWHWEEWEVIRKALPKNSLGYKLIMTTRVWSITEKCQTEQGAAVHVQKFGRVDAERLSAMRLSKSIEGTKLERRPAWGLSTRIANMCGEPPFYCCPLAVICLSSAWAESHILQQEGGDEREWDTAWASHILDHGFLSTPSLKPLVRSLCLGFDDLPAQLRTCLLYCTMYIPWYWIDKGCLVRKWVAEGFVSQVEVAEAYLDKLVSRNLLQLQLRMHTTVHPFMHAFLVCRAKEDNFIAYDGAGNNSSSHAKLQIRRISLTRGGYPDVDVLSHSRSLVVSSYECQLDGAPFGAFKKLRVLEIHKSTCPKNGHLVGICGFIWLKYLGLSDCCQITELPREIGRLQNLETLLLEGTQISKLPTEIRKLQHLRTLDVRGTKVREIPWEVQNSINVHVGNLDRFKMVKKLAEAVSPDGDIVSSSGASCRGSLSIVLLHPFNPRCEEPLQVPLLRVVGRHMKVPQWVKLYLHNVCSLDIRLCKLAHQDGKTSSF